MDIYKGKKILLLDGLTSQCLEYTKAFNALGCDTTVLCDDKFDTAYASKYPKHKILGISNANDTPFAKLVPTSNDPFNPGEEVERC